MGICCSSRTRPQKALTSAAACTAAFEQPVEPLGSSSSGARFFRLVPAACTAAFEQPVEPLGSSSSGARFFRLVPVKTEIPLNGEDVEKETNAASPTGMQCGMQWLGKDCAQAFDELEFYTACSQLREKHECHRWRFFDFLPSFHGIIRQASCFNPGPFLPRTRMADLLVFRSPLEGLARPRLLNLEVGPRTSALQLRKESELDTVMFARREGVRLEGFLSPPRSVPSEDPGIDTKGWTWGETSQRRAKRQAFQSLRLGEALAALVDLRDAILEERLWPSEGMGGAQAFAAHFLGPAEYSELALLHLVRELTSLLRASLDVPVPQKWFGGSVGLLVDAGVAPPRIGSIAPEAWVEARVKIGLFGWSRSKVTDLDCDIPLDELRDNELLWQIYTDSLGCILWEASRLYFHSFCAERWTQLSVQVFEANARGDALIGSAEVQLASRAAQTRTLPLVHPSTGAPVCGKEGAQSTVAVTTGFSTCSAPSRFAGLWLIQVDSASSLPPSRAAAPAASSTRPEVFAMVTLRERTSFGNRCSSQRTRMDPNRPDPCWREEFEFPVVSPGGAAADRLGEALGCGLGEGSGANLAKHMLQLAPEPAPGNTDACRMAALGQMAFIAEVQACWEALGPEEGGAQETSAATHLPSFPPAACGPAWLPRRREYFF